MGAMKLLPVLLSLFASPLLAGDFVPLFSHDGPPAGFIVRHWADVSQPPKDAAEWMVKDGVLTSVGARGCWLISEKDYGDFELEYEFKLGPLGNSGLAVRAPAHGDPAFDGLEMQMADLRYNPKAKDSELTGGFYRAVAPTQQLYQPEEWNRVRVKLEGTRATVELNGKTVQDIDLAKFEAPVSRHDGTAAPALKDRPLKGRIGFQELSRGGSHVLIRNAKIREN
jgi:hypothetical protein